MQLKNKKPQLQSEDKNIVELNAHELEIVSGGSAGTPSASNRWSVTVAVWSK